MSSCCESQSSRHPLKVHGCFDRGLRTRRLPALPVSGTPIATAYGLWACFSVRIENDTLADLRFQASACTTLIAYCQALVELSRHNTLGHAETLSGPALIQHLPGVPAVKHDRAILASAALKSVVATARSTITSTTGAQVA